MVMTSTDSPHRTPTSHLSIRVTHAIWPSGREPHADRPALAVLRHRRRSVGYLALVIDGSVESYHVSGLRQP